MSELRIKLNTTQRPKPYLRGKPDEDYIERHVQRLRDLMRDTGKTANGVWDFPAIEITPSLHVRTLRAKVRKLKSGKTVTVIPKAPKGERKFTTADGVHRVEIAGKLGMESIPARLVKPKTIGEMLAEQWTTNSRHGLLPTRTARDRWVVVLAKSGSSETQIATLMEIAKSSVSRIIHGKQHGRGRKTAEKKAAKRKAEKGGSGLKRTEKTVEAEDGISPSTFFDRLGMLVEQFEDKEQHEPIVKYAKNPSARKVIDAAHGMLAAFETAA